MDHFVMLLYGDRTRRGEHSPEEMQKIIAEYREWYTKLKETGQVIGGHKLMPDDGKIIQHDTDDVIITDGPFTEAKEVLGGLFVIQAASLDEAVALARTCPHVKYGFMTHVRQIHHTA
ncbi:MAG: transcription initiation protein [Phycisphaeraceae bacterium]|nr:hypothetical protein [Phycisphaerales bacterium]MCB9859817.1 transcription initiation protein [Phycisphaeraceae bacterium]